MTDDTSTNPDVRMGVGLTVSLLVLMVLWELMRSRVGFTWLGDGLVAILSPVLALGLAFSGQRWPWSRQSRAREPGELAPVLLGSAIAIMVAAEGIWAYLWFQSGQTKGSDPLPDLFSLAAYPFLVAGIVFLPNRPQHPVVRTRLVLDALTMMVAAVTVSWYFVLGPIVLRAATSTITTIANLADPGSELVVLMCLLLVLFRIQDPSLRWAASVLGLALVMDIVGDMNYLLEFMPGTFAIGQTSIAGGPISYTLIGLGAYLVRRRTILPSTDHAVGPDPPEWPVWRILLPYAPAPFVVAIVGYAWRARASEPLFLGVLLGSGCLMGLGAFRQVLVLLENRRLYRRLNAAFRTISAAREDLRASNQALTEANAALEMLSTTDPLTNLSNHRAINAALAKELERARRYRRPCSMFFVDLDHFKALNDTYGHPVGDAALRELGDVVSHTLRGVDTLGRWGGEEFVAILPEMEPAAALSVAERVRSAVASHTYSVGPGHLTCSIGVATYPTDSENRDALIACADQAMYAAKRLGRNQVRAANDPAVQALLDTEKTSGSREESALIGTVEALAAMVQARDHGTGEHMEGVAAITRHMAIVLGLNQIETRAVILAAELHDIGKVAIPDAVLRKPAALTSDEWQLIHTHPSVGADVVSHVPALRGLAPIIRAHHERWDGKGYPDGLAGNAIPWAARVIAVAESYHAMTSDRSYQIARRPDDALAELRRCAGSQFDPAAVEAMERVLTRPGSTQSPTLATAPPPGALTVAA